jgi:hypothetical protein
MFSESVYQVAHSWVDVGSFHTLLVVRFMNFTALSSEYFGITVVSTLCGQTAGLFVKPGGA